MRKSSNNFVLYILILILFISYLVYTQTTKEIAQKAFPSVVMIVMQDSNGQPLYLGSGFFIWENVVVTNFHVIEGAAKGYVRVIGQNTKYDIAGIVGIDYERDLVLLFIPNAKVPYLSIGDTSNLSIGDEVYVIGNPRGLEGTFSQGIISGKRNIDQSTIFQITAPISSGSSGGPVINNQGKVIGVAVATLEGGQNLNFAIPASYLATLVSDLKPVSSLSIKKVEQNKSITDKMDGFTVEGVT